MYNKEIRLGALRLLSLGRSKNSISKELGINRATIRDWVSPRYIKKGPVFQLAEKIDLESIKCPFESDLGYHYSYLLGLYLGDGYINKTLRAFKLRIMLDSRDIETNIRCRKSMERVFPHNSVITYKRKDQNCNEIIVYSTRMLELFPQHGEGVKWERKIKLSSWQGRLIDTKPEYFILGLIDSDGCFYNVKNNGKIYTHIGFVNKSKDIINLFCHYLSRLRIHFTKGEHSGSQIVHVYKQNDVKRVLTMYKELDNLK